LFAVFTKQSVSQVAFCGADEVAEIAFLSLKETPIQMAEIFSDTRSGERFFNKAIKPFTEISSWSGGPIVVTSAKDRERLIDQITSLEITVPVHCPGLTPTCLG
jgi:hypothetical protein